MIARTLATAAQRETARPRTRDRIEAAALRLFRERGFDRVTVEDICAAAAAAPATFYRQFGTKEGVVFGYVDDFAAAMDAAVAGVDSRADHGRELSGIVSSFAQFLESQQDVLALRDAIVVGHPALFRHSVGTQRELEARLANNLARTRGRALADDTDVADAAVVLLVLRLATRCWRSGRCPSLTAAAANVLTSLRATMSAMDTG